LGASEGRLLAQVLAPAAVSIPPVLPQEAASGRRSHAAQQASAVRSAFRPT